MPGVLRNLHFVNLAEQVGKLGGCKGMQAHWVGACVAAHVGCVCDQWVPGSSVSSLSYIAPLTSLLTGCRGGAGQRGGDVAGDHPHGCAHALPQRECLCMHVSLTFRVQDQGP